MAFTGAENMENDYMKRGYLLPPGCKDLIDVLKLKEKKQQAMLTGLLQLPPLPKVFGTTLKPWKPMSVGKPTPLPAVKGEIIIPAVTTAGKLAALLGQKPYLIIADLMELGIFANVTELLDFEAISKVARKYGFIVKKAT